MPHLVPVTPAAPEEIFDMPEWTLRHWPHVVPGDVVLDNTLTFRARGLFCYLLALPIEQRPTSAVLIAEEALEGRDALIRALKELIDHRLLSPEPFVRREITL